MGSRDGKRKISSRRCAGGREAGPRVGLRDCQIRVNSSLRRLRNSTSGGTRMGGRAMGRVDGVKDRWPRGGILDRREHPATILSPRVCFATFCILSLSSLSLRYHRATDSAWPPSACTPSHPPAGCSGLAANWRLGGPRHEFSAALAGSLSSGTCSKPPLTAQRQPAGGEIHWKTCQGGRSRGSLSPRCLFAANIRLISAMQAGYKTAEDSRGLD